MNIKAFLRKRQISNIAKSYFKALKKASLLFLRLTFAKRRILFVTNEKIRTLSIGPLSQLCAFFAIAWVANLFYQSLQYNKIISAKSEEIARLKNVTAYFDSEFSNIDNKLNKVSNYLITVTGQDIALEKEEKFEPPKNLSKKPLLKSEIKILDKIKKAANKISDIRSVASARINEIEGIIAITGLNIKKSNKVSKAKFAQGGPLVPIENYSASQVEIQNFSRTKSLDTAKFINEFEHLATLEKLTKSIPFARPIKTYFISSGFGQRVDPLTKTRALHQGLDFVGPKNEEILSPSSGTVILASRYSDYGNAIIIDHGFGITTRYGHLSKILVKKGQIVKKGQLIAKQGSTGRSTGQHLHYEVRYNNKPLNPIKFLRAGDKFIKKSLALNHAKS